MNVIGSRPDGWWRDRHAAMVRLVDLLERWAADSGEDVTVVFEQPPRPPIDSSVIEVAHAKRRIELRRQGDRAPDRGRGGRARRARRHLRRLARRPGARGRRQRRALASVSQQSSTRHESRRPGAEHMNDSTGLARACDPRLRRARGVRRRARTRLRLRARPAVAIAADPAGKVRGTMIMVHAGGWAGHDARAQALLMRSPGTLLRERGWRIVSIDYEEGTDWPARRPRHHRLGDRAQDEQRPAVPLRRVLGRASRARRGGTPGRRDRLRHRPRDARRPAISTRRRRPDGSRNQKIVDRADAQVLRDERRRARAVGPVSLAPSIAADVLLLREGDDSVAGRARPRASRRRAPVRRRSRSTPATRPTRRRTSCTARSRRRAGRRTTPPSHPSPPAPAGATPG